MAEFSLRFLCSAISVTLGSSVFGSCIVLSKKTKDDISIKEGFLLLGLCILWFVIFILSIGAWFHLPSLLAPYPIAGYIAAVLSILFMAFISSDVFLTVPNKEATRFRDMLWRELVKAFRSYWLYRINFRLVLSIAYVVILVLAQLETLNIIKLPDDLAFFFKINQYGLVIMYAFDKIVDSIRGRKKYNELVKDIDAEIEEDRKKEEEDRDARRAKKREKKLAKQKAHLLKQGKQEDEI